MYKVLIVDDESIVRNMLLQMMKQEGYETFEAGNGNEAIKLIEQHKPNLVVTDLLMPEKEGLEFIQDVRKHNKSIRIVAISGGSRLIDADQSLKTAKLIGADKVFKKPLDRVKFVEAIRELVES